jgi:MFS superfamily sulfate permease-like transporter
MLPSSTAAKDDASEADISDDLHGADSLHSDDMPGQQAAAGMCGACPPMPSTSGSLQQQVDCCSSTAQANAAPTALILLLLGILLTVTMDSSSLRGLSFGPQVPSIIVPTWAQLKAGILKAGIAQLPLTTLNSVIAVTALAKELFPTRDAARWSPTAVSIGVGAMNLVGCWFGAMPCCHGAGGLAAQHKFGARWVAAQLQSMLLRLHATLMVCGCAACARACHHKVPCCTYATACERCIANCTTDMD